MDNDINSNLEQKLREIGYEKTEFEPVMKNRFIVKIDGIQSFLICGITMPMCDFDYSIQPPKLHWNPLVLHVYNYANPSTEKDILKLGERNNIDIEVKYLDPTGDVITVWNFKTTIASINYGKFNWADTGSPNIIEVKFNVNEATIA